jgi:hypothetical protein
MDFFSRLCIADKPLLELWHEARLSLESKTKIRLTDNLVATMDTLPVTSTMKTALTNAVVRGVNGYS